MRRVTDTVPEELCVCIPCPVEQTMKYVLFLFFGSGSTVLTADIFSLDSCIKTVLLKYKHLCITC